MLMKCRPADGSDADIVSDLTGLKCTGKGRTKQEFKEECDINTIIDRFGIGYEIPVGVRVPTFADFSEAMDYQESLNAIRMAGESFMEMSAQTRSRFNNDAGKFVEFCSDPANLPEMRKLGLAVPEVVPEAPPQGVSPAAPAASGGVVAPVAQ